jgi:hypothetical protein
MDCKPLDVSIIMTKHTFLEQTLFNKTVKSATTSSF